VNPNNEVNALQYSAIKINEGDSQFTIQVHVLPGTTGENPLTLTKSQITVIPTNSPLYIDPRFTVLGDDVFTATKVSEVIFTPGSLITSMSDHVFSDCANLKRVLLPDSLTTFGNSGFANCETLHSVVLPKTLVTIGTDTFLGTSSMEYLKLDKELWKQFKSSFPENASSSTSQVVRFYNDSGTIIDELKVKQTASSNKVGYQQVIDFYEDEDRETYVVDRSSSESLQVVKGTGMVYDGTTLTGSYHESLTIVDPVGTELTQSLVDAALVAYEVFRKRLDLGVLQTLVVGPNFTSLSSSLSLQNTSIKTLIFPPTSPITVTTTREFRLVIDSEMTGIDLPLWVVQSDGDPWN
jgi:hypothetical protein